MISFFLTLKRLLSAVFRLMKERVFKSLLATLAIILLSGTLFYSRIEGWSFLDAFYYAFVSLIPTSVTTGLVPEAAISKWFTMIYLVVGVGVMLMIIVMIGFAVVKFEISEEKRAELKESNRARKKINSLLGAARGMSRLIVRRASLLILGSLSFFGELSYFGVCVSHLDACVSHLNAQLSHLNTQLSHLDA
ncbi:potassium channel family protein [Virgibacillus halodenitrificans]|uniref:potassium channel family protein n=1 Tax=Virgibacillus halodenitrificans TaxID=1482 RepID=UPI00045C81C0|nr:potassium channel family protein [Virgibacillus halodenitrificans]CDQ32489.1 Ion channel [Virgibacillus halodenitrificans]